MPEMVVYSDFFMLWWFYASRYLQKYVNFIRIVIKVKILKAWKTKEISQNKRLQSTCYVTCVYWLVHISTYDFKKELQLKNFIFRYLIIISRYLCYSNENIRSI